LLAALLLIEKLVYEVILPYNFYKVLDFSSSEEILPFNFYKVSDVSLIEESVF